MDDVRDACNLSDEDFAARRKALRETLALRARRRGALPDGLALFFERSPAMRQDLDAFVAFEQQCCPGLGFSVAEAGDALRLEIRGVDPAASIFAGIGEEPSEGEATTEPGWVARLLRSAGLGAVGAFFLFCVVPIGAAAVLGAKLAAPLAALDEPWLIGAGAVAFTALLWRWERRRAARRADASAGCGC